MQPSISSFFKKTNTPEKPKTDSTLLESKLTPTKLQTPSSPKTTKTTPAKLQTTPSKKTSPSSSPVREEGEKEKKKGKNAAGSDSEEKPSRKRKAAAVEKEDATKRLKEDEEEKEKEEEGETKDKKLSKRSFSNDTMLDDDATLANMEIPEAAATPKKSFRQPDDLVSDSELNNIQIPTSPSKPIPSLPSPSKPIPTTPVTPTKSPVISISGTPPKAASIFQPAGQMSESGQKIADLLTEPSWKAVLQPEFKKQSFASLVKFIEGEKAIKNNRIFPPENLIFNAFNHASFDKLRVVIIGQDPYINHNQAMGMSFSVNNGVAVPPSLRNIYKELANDIPSFKVPNHGNLTKWADQGVLLLNAVLTVNVGQSNSHKGKGWENITSTAIKAINEKKEGVVFLLWGKDAQNAAASVNTKKHLVLKSVHPSPMAADRGFFGCKHFSKCNAYLKEHGQTPIDWSL